MGTRSRLLAAAATALAVGAFQQNRHPQPGEDSTVSGGRPTVAAESLRCA